MMTKIVNEILSFGQFPKVYKATIKHQHTKVEKNKRQTVGTQISQEF